MATLPKNKKKNGGLTTREICTEPPKIRGPGKQGQGEDNQWKEEGQKRTRRQREVRGMTRRTTQTILEPFWGNLGIES